MPDPPACSRASPPTCSVFDVTAKKPLTVSSSTTPSAPASTVIGCSFGKFGGGWYAGWNPPIDSAKFGCSPQRTRSAICPETGYPSITESCRAASSEKLLFGKSSCPAIDMFNLTSATSGFGSRHFTSPRSATAPAPGAPGSAPSSAVISVGVPHPSFASGPNT